MPRLGNPLRLLSGLVAWAFGRRMSREEIPRVDRTWYGSTSLGEDCGSDIHCEACRRDGDCDACDTINGRRMDIIGEYAQTCDGCDELTENDGLTMDHDTQLSYCRKCVVQKVARAMERRRKIADMCEWAKRTAQRDAALSEELMVADTPIPE